MSIKYSFLMPYYNRAPQLRNTLQSFLEHYGDRYDYEVIIVEDFKNDQIELLRHALDSILREFKEIPIFRLVSTKLVYNPSCSYNTAVMVASGKYLIITNPECRHESNVLAGLDEEFAKNPHVYVVCACKSLKQDGSFHMFYQHSVIRNERYHFCSALKRQLYFDVGGFDERYAEGYCWDDNDFRDRLIRKNILFVVRDDLLVVHQWHEKVKPGDWRQRWERNRLLYESSKQ